jgi:hypothetical protein
MFRLQTIALGILIDISKHEFGGKEGNRKTMFFTTLRWMEDLK